MIPLDIAFAFKMKFGSVIGQGAYGMVYKCKVDGVKKDLAFKRNMADKTTTGMFSVKELDILSVVNGHPHIAKMEYIISGNISSYNPPNLKIEGIKDDLVHFVFERYTGDIAKTIYRSMDISTLKIMTCQVLLALEYLHLNGIMHRDIKPSNILWNRANGNFAICDFGMSTYWTGQVPLSSSVVTLWYRAPEITTGKRYLPNVDVWSVGMIMAGIVKGAPLLASCTSPEDYMSRLVSIMPSIRKHLQPIDTENILPVSPVESDDGTIKKDLMSYLKRDDFFGDQREEFVDLLAGMLDPDGTSRFSSSAALDHPFFNEYRKEIEDSRARAPKMVIPEVRISPSTSHKKEVMRLILEEHPNLYSTIRPFFHAVEIYNRYDRWRGEGRCPILDPTLEACAVLYLMLKYFAPIGFPHGISRVFQNHKKILEANISSLVRMEMTLCNRANIGYIYQETPLEVFDRTGGEMKDGQGLLEYYAFNSREGMTPYQVVSDFMATRGIELPLNSAKIVIVDK